MPGVPLYRDILEIARITIDTLRDIGVDNCCFFGGMACKLYTHGQGRKPKDLDILCVTPYPGGAEAIKNQLCRQNYHFRAIKSRRNSWKILWWYTDDDELGFEKFKIDILIPGSGDMELPYIHPDYVINIDRLPCVPLHLLLLHKLKGWDDRHYSTRPDQRAKIPDDKRDIRDLLRIANEKGLKITKGRGYITESFREDSYERVRDFLNQHPEFTSSFEGVGFTDEL